MNDREKKVLYTKKYVNNTVLEKGRSTIILLLVNLLKFTIRRLSN